MTKEAAAVSDRSTLDEQQVRDILRQVIAPEVGRDIVSLGLVYRIEVAPGSLVIEMTMTSPACPMGDMIVGDVHAALAKVLPAAIEPDIRGATTIREQLEKHRSNTSCASCHMTIDPPGFALENFDPIGSWRVRYGTGRKSPVVNPTGVTPDGAAFADLAEWKKIYSHRTDQLARGFAQQFLTYATGAKMRFSDGPEIEKVIKQTGKSGHGLRSILTTSLMSPIFLRK